MAPSLKLQPSPFVDFTVVGKSSGQYSSCPKRGKIEDFRYSGEAETTCGWGQQGRVYEGVGIWGIMGMHFEEASVALGMVACSHLSLDLLAHC